MDGFFVCLFVGKSQHKKITQHLLDKLEVMGNRVPTGDCFFASASCCSLKTGFPLRSPTGLILKENTDPVQRNRESSVKAEVTFLRGGGATREDRSEAHDGIQPDPTIPGPKWVRLIGRCPLILRPLRRIELHCRCCRLRRRNWNDTFFRDRNDDDEDYAESAFCCS